LVPHAPVALVTLGHRSQRKTTNVYDSPADTDTFIRYHVLPAMAPADFSASRAHGFRLYDSGKRGAHLDLPNGWLSVWIPLSGAVQMESADSAWDVPSGQIQVWCEGALRIGSRLSGRWLGLAAPAQVWARHFERVTGRYRSNLFTTTGACPRALRRALVRLARVLGGRHAFLDSPQSLVELLCAGLFDHQHELQERLQRCSGRTPLRREQTFQRLLRVRRLIEHHGGGKPDLERLARSANYSPWHLIRMYRDVFGETPGEHAARVRLERAWRMVASTEAPVCEITEALGFESQSAFCRAFKNAYGVTTTQARRAAPPPARTPSTYPDIRAA
jgi:AraC family transcriptional regulator